VAYQLDSSVLSLRHTEVITVPATAIFSVRYSEIATQIVFPQFEKLSCSLLHTILYRSERTLCYCCVAKGRTSDRETRAVCCYQFGDDIDRKSCGKFSQLNPQAHCVCAACCVTPWSTVQLGMSLLYKILGLTKQAGSGSRSQL
jgi:hypothetical protein